MSLRRAALRIVLALSVGLPTAASAWNAAGHRLVAVIAWQELADDDRRRVAALLAAHPDAPRWQRRIRPGDDPDRVVFSEASTWADDIRRDTRFFDQGREPETPVLQGFPDMARRRSWHYLNLPIDAARQTRASSPAGEIDRRLGRLAEILADRRLAPAQRAYALVWLIHLVGDIHQPLHVATRHDGDGDDGGGNGLPVIDHDNTRRPETNLHAWWDDLPGPPWLRGARLLAAAERLRESSPAGRAEADAAVIDAGRWRDESYGLAKSFVYAPWPSSPVTIDADYRRMARRLADERIVLAGRRLGRLLTALLAPPARSAAAE